jgi:predicted DsbA family dithiol-disulfide isomerase
MRVTRNQLYAALAVVVLAAGYFAVTKFWPVKLEFRDLAYPRGFRALVLDGGSTSLDPLGGMPKNSLGDAAPNPDTPGLCEALFRDFSPATGKQDSPVQIATFLDYRCPYCRVLADIMSKMTTDSVRVVYKEWPILGRGSVIGARAALAADRQGKYLAFHLRLMKSSFVPTEGSVEALAAELGLNVPQLRDDMNSDGTTFALQRNATLASALGFIGTPSMIVGHTTVQGEITRGQLDRLIEDEMRTQPKICAAG